MSETRKIEDILPDFPVGPLTPYRKQASFDWRKLKLSLEDEEILFYKHDIWNFFINNPYYQPPRKSLSFEEVRHLAVKRMIELRNNDILSKARALMNPKILAANCEAIYTVDSTASMKLTITHEFFGSTIRALGTEKHFKYVEAAFNNELCGCFALTEVAHGTNAKGLMTTATYDVNTKEFILHSSDFTAAKCWVGNLGHTATHAVVYAKLITQGIDQGLHAFVVPIRCLRTLKPFPGIIVGDMGEKIGLNGVDNGFMMFNSYRIPRDALLNKLADVDDNGNYVSPIKDPNKRFGASLGTLSGGRIFITGLSANNLVKAVTIAIRYSAVRKQFGPENSNEEFPVLEYQQQQFRLIPLVAAAYAIKIFHLWFSSTHFSFIIDSVTGVKRDDADILGIELHALSSASKPISAWLARDGIQVCREACGGHGYLKATGIGDIRNDHDANCTYEGENSILIQQTSNWLLSLVKSIKNGEKISSPLNSVTYFNDYSSILKTSAKFYNTKEATDPNNLLNAYKWLVCYMLKLTSEKAANLAKLGKDKFTVKNETQTYNAMTLSAAYFEHALFNHFYVTVLNIQDNNCRQVMLQLVSLFGSWCLEKHLSTLYMGGYLSGNSGQLLREGVIELCSSLKPEVVTLVDTVSPPDFVLNSVLGRSDGNAYQHIQESFFTYPGNMSRPEWWQEVVNWDTTVPSKL